MQFKGSKVTRRSIRLWQPLSGNSMPCGICWLWRWMHSDCLNPAIGRFRPALGADGSDRTVHNTGQSSVVDMNAATGSLSRWSRLAARPQQVAVDWSRRPPSRTKCDEPHLSLKRHPVPRRFAPVRPFKDRECCPPPPPNAALWHTRLWLPLIVVSFHQATRLFRCWRCKDATHQASCRQLMFYYSWPLPDCNRYRCVTINIHSIIPAGSSHPKYFGQKME